MYSPGVPVARERITKRNDIYVIRKRGLKAREMSRNDRKGKNNTDISDERREEKLGWVACLQVGNRIQETVNSRQ